MKKIVSLLLLLALGSLQAKEDGCFKNVILMIPDGMSQGGLTLTRWVQGGKPLPLDELASGMVRTYCATAPITDSAPAASAMATGFKTDGGAISVLPWQNEMPGLALQDTADAYRPVATVLEAAKLRNKATGLVATCEIMHATPASFAGHCSSRNNYSYLSEQLLFNRLDVVLGGGYHYFTAEGRKDKENLIPFISELGYRLVQTPAEMHQVEQGRIFGLFAPAALANDLDRDALKEPSLAEMTMQAIKLLKQNREGFFLMVEGSKVDWAAHANEPVAMVSEITAFNRAVQAAVDFAKADGNTAVIICSDHGNSGITIGNRTTDYDTKLAVYTEPFHKATRTAEAIEDLLNADRSNIKSVLAQYYAITDLNDTTETPLIKSAKPGSLSYVIGPMFAKRAELGFTSNGHTGEDLVLYAYAPGDQPHGTLENTDIARKIEKWLGLDLQAATAQLFTEAKPAFTALGAEVTEDLTDQSNPVLVVKKNSSEIRFPVNRNYGLSNAKKTEFKGVTVYNGNRWFLPKEALGLLK